MIPEMPLFNKNQMIIGVATLFIGLTIYFTDRPSDQIYLFYCFSIDLNQYKIPNLLGPLNNNLPAFIHVFSFSLITAGLISSRKRKCFIVCLGWLFINLAFELGQKFEGLAVSLIPNWFECFPILENFKNYFSYGTFDFYDLLAAAIGAIAAYILIFFNTERSDELWKKRNQFS